MAKNPLEAVANFYKKCVEKQDKKGFAELYKKSTQLLFDRLKKETNLDLHFENIKYLDGYFIFGFGTNSIVHFHIKEIPGWLFGIWWSPIPTDETKNKKKQEYKTDRLYCEFFFQFEKEIDKFKPTASMFGGDFEFVFADGYNSSSWIKAYRDLEFVYKEPYLAFYKEMHYTDFNHEYVSREKAKRYWNKHWKEKEKEKQLDLTNATEFMNMVKYIIKPMVEAGEAYIQDQGSCVSPRYEIIVKNITLSDGKPMVEEPGCYNLFDGWNYPDLEDDKKLWKKTEKACAKRAGYKYYYGQPCHQTMLILDPKNFKKCLNGDIADGSAWFYKKEDGTIFEGRVHSRYALEEDD